MSSPISLAEVKASRVLAAKAGMVAFAISDLVQSGGNVSDLLRVSLREAAGRLDHIARDLDAHDGLEALLRQSNPTDRWLLETFARGWREAASGDRSPFADVDETEVDANTGSDLLTPAEVAAWTRLSVGALATRRHHGLPPAFLKPSAKRVLYRRSAVAEWLAEAARTSTQEREQ